MSTSKETAFSESQYQNIYPEGVNKFYWNDARNHILLNTINNLKLSEPIVEVGCGKGAVIEFLNSKKLTIKGYELANIEPFNQVKHLIQTNIDANKIEDDEAFQYRTLLLLDVIEHIEFPIDFINNLINKFKNVDHIIIMAPACNELFSNYDTYCGHYLRYDIKDIINLAESLKMEIIYKSYFFKGLYLPAKILKKLRLNRSTTINPPRNIISSIVHKIVSSYFLLEQKILPSNWKGSSLLFVLKKSSK